MRVAYRRLHTRASGKAMGDLCHMIVAIRTTDLNRHDSFVLA